MTSGQETEWVYSYNSGACMGLGKKEGHLACKKLGVGLLKVTI